MKKDIKQPSIQKKEVDSGRIEGQVQHGATISDAEKQKILRQRAKALAQEPLKKESAEEHLEILEFLLAYEKYAVESKYIREVYPLKEFTPLPCTPPFVLGIINVRGQIFSVIELKKFFDLPEKGISNLNKVIIISTDEPVVNGIAGMEFGVLADAILGVRLIPVHEIQPTLPTLTGIREGYLRGITKDRVVILDGKKLLSDQKIIVNEQVEG